MLAKSFTRVTPTFCVAFYAVTLLGQTPPAAQSAILEEIKGAPDEFLLYLQDKLDRYEQNSNGYWPANGISVTGSAKPVGKKVQLYLQFRDHTRPKQPVVVTWQGVVPPGGSVASAQKCLNDVLPKLDPTGVAKNLAQAANLQGMRLSLNFIPTGQMRPGGAYFEGDELVLQLKSTQKGWAALYNLNPEGEPPLTQIWPVKEGQNAAPPAEISPGEAGIRVGGAIERVGRKRREMIVAVVWRSRKSANEMAAAQPQSLQELAKTIKKVGGVAPGTASNNYAVAYLTYTSMPKPGDKEGNP